MNYYFVILLRQKPQSEWQRRMSIISLLCTVLSRHFPWLVRFSNVLCIFQVNKDNDYNDYNESQNWLQNCDSSSFQSSILQDPLIGLGRNPCLTSLTLLYRTSSNVERQIYIYWIGNDSGHSKKMWDPRFKQENLVNVKMENWNWQNMFKHEIQNLVLDIINFMHSKLKGTLWSIEL